MTQHMPWFSHFINKWSQQLGLSFILILIVGLNIYWGLTLSAFGSHFEQLANAPLLDLENVGSILSPEAAMTLVTSYSSEARSLYWVFFILDNLIPPIVFGSFALLWAYAIRHFPPDWANRLLRSHLLLLPLGVGLFDCLENLCFVLVISGNQELEFQIMQLGLIFVYLKAICLFLVFGVTPLLILTALVSRIRRGSHQMSPLSNH